MVLIQFDRIKRLIEDSFFPFARREWVGADKIAVAARINPIEIAWKIHSKFRSPSSMTIAMKKGSAIIGATKNEILSQCRL